MFVVSSDDYSSVTSADIDKALSDDDDDDDKDGGDDDKPLAPTTNTTGTGSRRHVAFVEQEVTVGGDVQASTLPSRLCFRRGMAERQTLPTFSSVHDMKTSRDTEQRQQRPRSKSVGRSTAHKKDSDIAMSLVDASTVSPQTSTKSESAVRGERLSNYGQGTLLVGRRPCPPTPPSASTPSRPDTGSRLLSGRRSIDSVVSRRAVKPPVSDRNELGALTSPYSYLPARRRCVTPVSEAGTSSDTSLFAGYHLRRPQLPSTPVSDSGAASYYASPTGRRSLPRTQAHSSAFYHADSSQVLPPSALPCTAPASPSWPPRRPQSSTASNVSTSADNMRKH